MGPRRPLHHAQRTPLVALVTLALAACSGGPGGASSARGTAALGNYPVVAWPTEPAPDLCGDTCGEWLPYTRFQRPVKDPRTQDPSNGGTAPQNYVNVSSSCTDKALPSVYYAFHKDPSDPTRDVIFFRWRVEQPAHTYATGPSAGSPSASDPWSSALWTVLFDVDGSGYRQLAAHIDGSSGSPSTPIDKLAGIYGKLPTQSIDYLSDPANIKLIDTWPTAFADGSTGVLLNYRNSLSPTPSWPNGSAETTWDYGSTRARLVSTRPCTEYFVDYQIPVAMLDASSLGGPKITRSTPISMLFCTANSLNNPLQKDCALNRTWNADASSPGPFGDYISFDQTAPYAQPIISKVTSTPPPSCSGTYTLTAQVQDSLYVNGAGRVVPSVKAVSFWYYFDADGDGVADDGNSWTFAANASLVAGQLNQWTASWDGRSLARGNYLIGAQAVDDNRLVDDGMTPTGVDNRTFSYVTSDSLGRIYVNQAWRIDPKDFPVHSPALSTSATESWYGNPLITGLQVSGASVGVATDVALNACGVGPTLALSGTPASLGPGEAVSFTVTLSNAGNPRTTSASSLSVQLPSGFRYTGGSTSGVFGTSEPAVSGTTLTWTPGAPVQVAAGATRTLTFSATATSTAGQYNAVASAVTTDGTLTSGPAALTVYAAATTITNTPSRYAVPPDGATQVVYTIAYGNASAVSLGSATLTDALPANVSFVSCSGGASCASGAGTVTWNLGTLAAGAQGTATLTVTVGSGYLASALSDVATLSARTPAGLLVQNSATAVISVTQPVPLYSLTATSNPTTVATSGSVTWTLSYGNPGNGAAGNTLLVDSLPDGFTFASCSVAGSHFAACTNVNGTVTFSGPSGAAVSLPAGASGTVTVTGTAAATFTYTNPAVDRATLGGASGVAAASATAAVGVTGQYCSNVFYFHQGTDNVLSTIRPATLTAPTSTFDYTTVIASVTNGTFSTAYQVAFESPPFQQAVNLAGQTATIDFNLSATAGGTLTQVVIQKISGSTTTDIQTSSTIRVNNGQAWYPYSFSMPNLPSSQLAVGDKLRWQFQFSGSGGKDITFHYDSIANNSRSSFCVPSAPASLAVTDTVDKTAIPGTASELLTYTLTASNLGGTAAAGVVLTDTLAAGMTSCQASTNGTTWTACSSAGASPPSHAISIGSLAASASTTVYVRGYSPTSPSTTSLVNQASLSGTGLATASATASTEVTSIRGTATPSLAVTASADRGTVSPGETVTYTIGVVNVGSAPASNVTITDVLPATAWYGYVAGSATGGTSRSYAGGTLSWTLSSLAIGASTTLTFQMIASPSGLPDGMTALSDTATASDPLACTGASPPASCTSNTVTVLANGSADLGLSGSVGPASPQTVAPGGILTYTLLVESKGSSTATGVVLDAGLAPHTRFRRIVDGTGFYDAASNQVVFDLGSLPSGTISTVHFEAQADSTLPAGTTALPSTWTVAASNAQQRTYTVTAAGLATLQLEVSSAGPASLPDPAARLTAPALAATAITVDTSARLEVGGYVLVGGAVSRIVGISGNTVTLDPTTPATAASGAPLYRSASYAVSTTNQGTAAASAVSLQVQVPSGWTYVSASPSPTSGPDVAGKLTWDKGTIAAGSSDTVQLILIPTRTATLTSTLSDPGQCVVASTTGCTATTTTVVGGLTASVKTSTPFVSAGGTAIYTITLANSLGTSVGGVTLSDLLPSGFQYLTASPAASSVSSGQPTWSGLTIPAGGTLQLTLQATVATSAGAGTYDDPIAVTAGAGTGVTPFDALATTDDDVTVLNGGWSLTAGYVFLDRAPLATFDSSDTGLEDVAVTINDASNQPPYLVHTDGFGYFRQLVPGGGTWTVAVPADLNVAPLAGLSLQASYTSSTSVDVTTAAASELRFGYVSSSSTPQYTVSTQVIGGGTVTPTSVQVDHGSTTSLTITPYTGHATESVTGCGGTLAGTTYTTGAITADCTVTATFVTNKYTVSTSVTGSGTITPTSASVDYDTTTTLSIAPAAGHSIQSVTGCGGTLSGTTYTTSAITADCTVTATFVTNKYTVSTSVTGSGTITPTSASVDYDTTTTLSIAPAAGHSIQSVTGCGGTLSGSTYTTGPITADCTVSATFVTNKYTVSTSVTGSGTITPTSASVDYDTTTTLSIAPAAGHSIQSVTGCGGTLSGTTYTTSAITADCTVTATFVINKYTVSTSITGSGTVSPTSAQVDSGSMTSFVITPDVGHSIQSVTGCGGILLGNAYTTGFITADCTVSATFVIDQYTVSTSITGSGTVSPTSATVDHGSTTTLVIAPSTGYSVQSVTGCGGTLSGSTYTTAAVTADCTVTATFVINKYTVSTSITGSGTVSPTSATVDHGSTTTLAVTPSTGYSIQSVTGCGGTLSGSTYTTSAITGDCTVTATFVINEYTVSTSITGSGTVSPTSATVDHDTTTSFTVTPAAGYSIQSVTGCGGNLSGSTYTTGAVTADCTVTASFSANPPASITIAGGDAQSTAVTTPFALPLAVVVRDAGGHPLSGVPVTFTVPASGATATVTSVVATGADGVASTSAIANARAGAYAVLARVSGVLDAASFSLRNLPGPAVSLRRVSGNGQSTRIGTDFSQPLVVEALDADANPVPGAAVTFTPPASSPGASLTPSAPVTTGDDGLASASASADGAPGAYSVTASLVTGQAASFQLANTYSAPLLLTAVSGGDQTATVGGGFALPLVARVTQDGQPVAGAPVTFTPPSSGASAVLSATTVITGADGYARVTATATTVSGDYQVRASCPRASAEASFAEANAPDAPIAFVLGSASSPQATTVGTAFANAVVVTLVDSHGNPVPGVRVTFAPPAIGPSAVLQAIEATSDSEGRALLTASANEVPGGYLVEATAPGIPAASFRLTNLIGASTYVTAVSGTPQRATVGTTFGQPLVARVTDQHGAPVPGVEVTWTAPASGATAALEVGAAVTDADGLAQAQPTAGSTPGRYDVTASAPDCAAPALFVLTNGAGAPVSLTVDPRTTPQSAGVGTAFPLLLRAHVVDLLGNPVPGVTVTFTPSASEPTATLSTASTVTDESGDATVQAIAGATAGAHSVSASVAGLSPVRFELTNQAFASPTATLELRSGSDQTTSATTAYPEPLVLRVLDGGGAPVAGVAVHLALPASGPSATTAERAISDAQGEVRFTLTALTPLGTFTLQAFADGLATPVTARFTVTAIPTATAVRATPSEAQLGDTVTLQAQVTSDHGTPSGTVTFTLDGAELAAVPLAGGAASTRVAAGHLGLGAHAVVAHYAGAEPFATSASPTTTVVITPGRDTLDGGGGCASSGGGGGWPTLALLAVAWVLLRRRRRLTFALALALALTAPAPALAQATAVVRSPGAAVNAFSPAPAGSDWAAVDSLRFADRGLALRALLDYARRPLVIYHADGSTRRVVIARQLWLHAGASLVVRERLRLSLAVPLALHQTPIDSEYNGERIEPTRSSGLGDVTVSAEVLLLGAPQAATRLGAGVDVLLPTGAQRADLGDGHVGAVLHVNGAGRVRTLEWAAEAGYLHRSGARIGDARFGPALRGKGAMGLRLLGGALLVGPEVYLSKGIGASSGAAQKLAIEGDASARVWLSNAWSVHLGIGTGLKRAAGIPDWRALAGVQWSPGYPSARPARAEPTEPSSPAPDAAGARTVPLPEDGSDAAPEPRPPPAGPRAADGGAPEVPPAPPPVASPPVKEPEVPGAAPAQLASLAGAKIVTLQPVHFRTDKAILEARSFALLGDVSAVLLAHPEIGRVRVEGHTDLQGVRAHNLDLSQRRAQAVVDFLVGKGVPRERLEARGFGPDRPIADDRSAEGRAANRRVEFIVLGGAEPPATSP